MIGKDVHKLTKRTYQGGSETNKQTFPPSEWDPPSTYLSKPRHRKRPLLSIFVNSPLRQPGENLVHSCIGLGAQQHANCHPSRIVVRQQRLYQAHNHTSLATAGGALHQGKLAFGGGHPKVHHRFVDGAALRWVEPVAQGGSDLFGDAVERVQRALGAALGLFGG